MTFLPRVARPIVRFLALLALAAAPFAAPATAEVPWLYKGSDVPPDPAWVFGTLPNGLRYAVRTNGVPPGQVSIRVRVDAGALNEHDDEQGFAHLIEHLVFRQSKYLGDGEAIPAWQRLGATFGSDTNAETTSTQTVFKLDLPNATPAALDDTFKYLSGMVTAPTLSDANICTDLPIVLAEMRERGGTAQRAQDRMREVFYAGQLLGARATIGTPQSLAHARQDTVRAFYHRWYRPENTVVIVAGDADTAALTALVTKWFGDWQGNGPPVTAPSFGAPVAPASGPAGAPLGSVDTLVSPELPRNVTYAILRPWHQVNDTIVYNQGLMLDSIAQALINRRLETKARKGGSFLTAQVSQDNVSRSANGTFVSVTPLGPDWRAALADVRGVIADAIARPPTQAEIDREVAEIDVSYQVPVEQARLQLDGDVADTLVNALDIRETVAAPSDVLAIFRRSKPLFTPANVLAHTRAMFAGTVTRALLVASTPGEASPAALHAALLAPPRADPSARTPPTRLRFADLPAIGPPGKIASLGSTGLLEIERLDFANGVKVLLWPVKDEPGRVMVKVRFGGGYRAFSGADAPYVTLGQIALVGSGVGPLDENDLDRISTGRKMGFDFDIDDTTFTFSAETRQADLADQLYLFADKFANPRWDPHPVARAKATAELQYPAYASSPQGVLNRELKFVQRGRDPRYRAATPAELAAATPDGFRKVWTRALATGPIEVQVFGDFDHDAAIAALTTTFGALAPRPPLPADAAAATARTPSPTARPILLTHRGNANQAVAVVSWPTGGGSTGIAESRRLDVLSQLFTNRLLAAMREKLGASYAPQVVSNWPVDLDGGGAIMAVAQLEPKAVPVFFRTADEIASDLVTRPPSSDELARVIEPLRQLVTRQASGSAFFMRQLEGATADPRRLAALPTFLSDYTSTTSEQLQALAAKYLIAAKAWRLEVVPDRAKPTVAAR